MPSKKQRAKKPGSKVAREKVAEESRRGFAWAHHEDDAAQWVQRQLQKERESASRGCCAPPVVSRDESPAGDRADECQELAVGKKSCDGGLTQYAVDGRMEMEKDQAHHAALGVMKVHTPGHQHDARDVMNTRTTPVHNGESEVKDERKAVSASTKMDLGTMAMKGLLKEHGLNTVPPEWHSTMGKLLLREVLQVRVNKLKKAKQQRDKRRENRKQQ